MAIDIAGRVPPTAEVAPCASSGAGSSAPATCPRVHAPGGTRSPGIRRHPPSLRIRFLFRPSRFCISSAMAAAWSARACSSVVRSVLGLARQAGEGSRRAGAPSVALRTLYPALDRYLDGTGSVLPQRIHRDRHKDFQRRTERFAYSGDHSCLPSHATSSRMPTWTNWTVTSA